MMMATAEPPSSSSLVPLLECLEDGDADQSEQTDAYLTIANRLSGEEGRQFLPAVETHFSRLGKTILTHINSPSVDLSQAALQALGFCVYHSHVVSGVPETFAAETLSALCSLAGRSTDKNTCTRALWVISKQSFPPDVLGPKVESILGTLESVWSREDVQSVVMEHEALNVVIRMLEQVPAQMGEGAVRWARLVVPLVVHSAPKVRLRAAAAMEMGLPLLLERQTEVAAVIEPLMSTKLVPELQKLFMSKNETNVLKLWPLFVRLLGKLLHRGGPFINSLLHLEELGFRSSSPSIKKIAFLAWKSLIDNFALNPDILCSTKRMKLLMQPLMSIQVRTEALMLTKVEVWWYLVVQLGPHLSTHFDQVAVPLLQSTIGSEPSSVPGTPSRAFPQNGVTTPGTPKAGAAGFSSPANASRLSLNSSMQLPTTFPSIQLLGLEMLLHCFAGPEAAAVAAKNKLVLSLELLRNPLVSGASSFTKHAAVLVSSIRDGITNVGKDAPDSLLSVIWTSLARAVSSTIESGSKKDRQGCDVLTLMLQALQSIVTSESLPAAKVLILFEATVTEVPQRVLGSASYQVGKMDVLNGTPALFLLLLLYDSSMFPAYVEDERFAHCLQALVGCGLSGPTSPLAFAEAVLGAFRRVAGCVRNKERLWRMWSVMVGSLTDTVTQSNEVNQGDALEHNFSALHAALLFPVTHLLPGAPLQQVALKSMLGSWSRLYQVFARCSALVATAEENVCCEELCTKMAASIDRDALKVPSTLNAVSSILHVVVECVDFSPYAPQCQHKLKSPHTPVSWMRKRSKALGNLSTFQSLLVQCLEVYLEDSEASAEPTGLALVSILSALFTNLVLANAVQEALASLMEPLTLLYKQAGGETPRFTAQLQAKLEKLLGDVLGCLQSRSTLAFDDQLLARLCPLLCVVFPHKSKPLRTLAAHFWNATFANSLSLTYPDEIRPILSQVKQKTPIILPGFEAVTNSDELSGPYSSECSQLETKLSGIPFSSAGKRESLLKDTSSPKISKPVSTKLDFSSPKPPRREVLEEEASVDFVFIPPETKERVLTEHQKEVKRIKRVDIPAMYNNLDASLDATAFTQYTQSQEDSADKLPTQAADELTEEAPGKVLQEAVETEEDAGVVTREAPDDAGPKSAENVVEEHHQEEVVLESRDVSAEGEAKRDDKPEPEQTEEDKSPSVPGSSDSAGETPVKPKSRRQAFITLEKYVEGKAASPSSASTFTGSLIKTPKRPHASKTPSPQPSQTSPGPNSQGSQSTGAGSTGPHCPVSDAQESPRRPKDCGMKSGPVRLIERLQGDTTEDEDVIPDTQTQVKPSSQEGESDTTLDDSQASPGEPRRSGRHRTRPLLPGDDPKERDNKYKYLKGRRSGAETKSDSPKSSSAQSRPNTRSMQAAEEDGGRERLRTRAQRDRNESSAEVKGRKRIKLFRNSQDFLDEPQPKRRSARESESSQTDLQADSQSDYDSQSQGRRGRPGRPPAETKEAGKAKAKRLLEKRESSQGSTGEVAGQAGEDGGLSGPSPQTSAESQGVELVEQTDGDDGETNRKSQPVTTSPPTCDKDGECERLEEPEKGVEPKTDSQSVTTSPQCDGTPGESELVENANKETGSQSGVSPPDNESGTANELGNEERRGNEEQLENEEQVKDDENLSQDDTPPSSESQSCRRSRRSKASSETTTGRQSRSNSQTPPSAQTEARGGGRTRRSKVQEEEAATGEGSQSTTVSSRGRYSRQRSSQAPSVDTSGSESSETRESSPKPRRRGKKPQAPPPSPLTLECTTNDEDGLCSSTDAQTLEAPNVSDDSPGSQDLQGSESVQAPGDAKEPSEEVSTVEAGLHVVGAPQKSESDDTETAESGTDADVEMCESPVSSAVDTRTAPPEERLEEAGDRSERADVDSSCSQKVSVNVEDCVLKDHAQSASDQPTEDGVDPLQRTADEARTRTLEPEDGDPEPDVAAASDASVSAEPTSENVGHDSPAKQKDLEALMGLDVGQSPVSGRTRGTWSPSASPSTSILKKGQKRPLEDSPSPLVKSRRVSFADPIQRQEVADDIDRRSPAIRTSSPRRSKASLPQPKYVTTPTKGLSMCSPRTLHSPGYKSSKKSLISELSQEPRPVSRDCVYPALVGCSAPVEAVLPQISSSMWSRGFGQLVRARNIKTVGDLSALTPGEIKTLPIRSPKISNVRKALRVYQQQRKGRGGDELKSFDETEMMTSEPEETRSARNLDEEDKTSGETLAMELVDEQVPAEEKLEQDVPGNETLAPLQQQQQQQHQRCPGNGLPSHVEALACRATPLELGGCSPQQLVQMHEQLSVLMRRVVVELQTRLCHTDADGGGGAVDELHR